MRKRLISLILGLIMVISTMTNSMLSFASDSEAVEISSFRDGKEIGEYDYPSNPGYVFAGWYDQTLTNAIPDTQKTGNAYAKWVKEEVLSVKFQILQDTTSYDLTTTLRLVATVDSKDYQEVGFVISFGEGENKQTATVPSTTVYKTLIGNGVTYTPEDNFDTTSKFFVVYELYDIPRSMFDTDITVTPYWKTLDGTIVEGVGRDINITKEAPWNHQFKTEYSLRESLKKGQLVTFEFDTDAVGRVVLYAFEQSYWTNQHKFDYSNGITGPQTITIELQSDVTNLIFYVDYKNSTEAADENCNSYVSNIQIDEMAITLANDTDTYASKNLNMAYTKGQLINFDIDTKHTGNFTFYVLEDGSWQRQHRYDYTTWTGKQNLTIQLTADVTYLQFYFGYKTASNYETYFNSVSNVRVLDKIVLNQQLSNTDYNHVVNLSSLSGGQTISFDFDTTATGKFTLWVLENGSWSTQHRFDYTAWSGKQTLSVQLQGTSTNLMFYVRYGDSGDYSSYESSVSNISVN